MSRDSMCGSYASSSCSSVCFGSEARDQASRLPSCFSTLQQFQNKRPPQVQMSNGKGKQPQCDPVYIATGCNRFSNVADVRERDGLVAFGAGKIVALWNSEVGTTMSSTKPASLTFVCTCYIQDSCHRGVHQTLPGHSGDVVSVKFLRSDDSALHCAALVSGDSAGRVNIWVEDIQRGVSLSLAQRTRTRLTLSLLLVCLRHQLGPARASDSSCMRRSKDRQVCLGHWNFRFRSFPLSIYL